MRRTLSPSSATPLFLFSIPLAMLACVPPGNSTPSDSGVPESSAAKPAPTTRSRLNSPPLLSVFEDTFDRVDAGAPTGTPVGDPLTLVDPKADARAKGADGSTALGSDAAPARPHVIPIPNELGPDWIATRLGVWKIEKGKLCGEKGANHGVWLNRTLPTNARIEFDAQGFSEEGDLKAEVWGDGQSFAKGTSYNDATSYLAIFGGWKNTLHVLARLDEHGEDRKVLPVDLKADDIRQRPAARLQVYRFKIEREDGRTIAFSIDGRKIHSWTDEEPLTGPGHDHFGFNNWDVKVCYDNVKVTPLP